MYIVNSLAGSFPNLMLAFIQRITIDSIHRSSRSNATAGRIEISSLSNAAQ